MTVEGMAPSYYTTHTSALPRRVSPGLCQPFAPTSPSRLLLISCHRQLVGAELPSASVETNKGSRHPPADAKQSATRAEGESGLTGSGNQTP